MSKTLHNSMLMSFNLIKRVSEIKNMILTKNRRSWSNFVNLKLETTVSNTGYITKHYIEYKPEFDNIEYII